MTTIEAPLGPDASSDAIRNLHEGLLLLLSRGAIDLSGENPLVTARLQREIGVGRFGDVTQLVTKRIQAAANLQTTGIVDAPTAKHLNDLLRTHGAFDVVPEPAAGTSLSGTLSFPNGAPAGGVEVHAYSAAFGGKETPFGKDRTTASGTFTMADGKPGQRLQVVIKAVAADGTQVPLMSPRLVVLPVTDLNLVAPDSLLGPPEAELDRLAAAANAAGVTLAALGKSVENKERSDFGALHAATGWDARLLALASLAVQANERAPLGIGAHYALMRVGSVGFDGDASTLSREEVRAALERANSQGITSLGAQEIRAALSAHQQSMAKAALDTRIPGAVSPLTEIFAKASVTADEQDKFVRALSSDWNTTAELWQRAATNGLSDAAVAKLQALGRLSTLTQNNGPLAGRLVQDFAGSPPELTQLAAKGYYQPDAWLSVLNELSGGDAAKLGGLVPDGYEGDTAAARAGAYAGHLARQVRREFPGEVIAARVAKNEIKLADSAAEHQRIAEFVTAAAGKGYRIGRTPLSAFFKGPGAPVLAALNAADRDRIVRSTRRLHRLYQLTPDDESMVALASHGVSTAADITAVPEGDFVRSFKPRLSGDDVMKTRVAERVYRKAEQVHAATRMIVSLTQLAQGGAPVFALTSSPADRQQHIAQILNDVPSLERLLGNQDFCACEHCRSVLSPAAYFVDLLHFLDPGLAPAGTRSPFEELNARRPDLQEIALTCENTHTALPYIDLVNEILEGYIEGGMTPNARTFESGQLTTADLIAEPERLSAAVYDKLRGEKYPLSLPFDLWTETMRAYCDRFGTPYAELIAVFQQPATLFQPVAGSTLTRGKILAEQLGLAESDYELLTTAGQGANDVATLYGHRAASPVTVADLSRVHVLTRQLGITVGELTDLVMTSFVNPRLELFLRLQRWGVPAETVFSYLGANGYPALDVADRAELLARIRPMLVNGTAGDVWLQDRWNAGDFDDLLVIRRQPNDCDPSTMRLVLVRSGNAVPAAALLRLNVMVRLWRKLGWRIDELDAALTQSYPASGYVNVAGVGPAVRTALLGLAHLEAMNRQYPVGKDGRLKWLAVWGAIPQGGKRSLYNQLFVDGQSSSQRAIFDPPLGERLPAAGAPALSSQLTAVMAATGVAAEEIDLVLQDQFAPGAVPGAPALSMATVARIYRYALLAKALKIGIRDLVALRQLSGMDVFVAAPGVNLPDAAAAADDLMFENTIRFAGRVRRFQAAGLKTADLQYLLRDDLGQAGAVVNPTARALALLRVIRAGVERAIRDNVMPLNANELTSEWLQQKLSLLLPQAVADEWVAMLDGTRRYDHALASAVPLFRAEELQAYPELSTRFDGVRDQQVLTCAGVLSDARRTAILQDLASDPANLRRVDLAATLTAPLTALTNQAKGFYQDALIPSLPGLPGPLAFGTLFDNTTGGERRQAVAQAMLPSIRDVAQRLAGTTAVADFYGSDPDLLATWMQDARLAIEPGVEPRQTSVGLAARGMRSEYFTAADLTGASHTVTQPTPQVSTDPAVRRSVRFRAYFSVPARGTYRFQFVARTPGETCALRILGIDGADFSGQTAAGALIVSGAPVELQEDTLYGLDASVLNLVAGGSEFRLLAAQDPALQSFADVECWPLVDLGGPHKLLGRFDRLLRIQDKLALSSTELKWIFDRPDDFGTASIVDLPAPPGANAAALQARFEFLASVADYCAQRNRDEWLPEQVGAAVALLSQRSAVNDAAAVGAALTALTHALAGVFREPATALSKALVALQLDAVSVQPVAAGGFQIRFVRMGRVAAWVRLSEALRMARLTGLTCTDLARWSQWPLSAAIVADARATIRSRYADDDWRRTIQPIADRLRQRRRDALVAHLLHALRLQRMEQLYAYFLLDPGMEPVVLTSRIRMAIATVQHFITRCLQNHEPQVSPAHIDSERWRSIRRYRIWEAARRILLFPENWLEPEFRTDASPLFKAMLGDLLQGDITDDAVEGAVFKYLQGLQQVARLQIVASYEEWKDNNTTVLHVIGRTFASPHKYFYRRLLRGIDWTAWEPVGVDIEGDHVVATIWRDRLCLFWLTVIEGSRQSATAKNKKFKTYQDDNTDSDALKPQMYLEIWCSFAEYVNGEWLPRQSTGKKVKATVNIDWAYQPKHLFVHAVKRASDDYPDSVEVCVNHTLIEDTGRYVSFRFNSPFDPAQVIQNEPAPDLDFQSSTPDNWTRHSVSEWTLTLNYAGTGKSVQLPVLNEKVRPYGRDTDFYLLPTASAGPLPSGVSAIEQSFFYEDHRNTFFVTADVADDSIEVWDFSGVLDRWRDYRRVKPPRQPLPIDPFHPPGDVRRPPVEDPDWGTITSPDSLITPAIGRDLVVRPTTTIRFGDMEIGESGPLSRVSAMSRNVR